MSNFKRTRSQLALPDFDINQLARSPLKDAKSALRNLQSTPPHNSAAPNRTHDEDLGSFKKHMKRASSPFKETSFANERTPKRLRHEDQRVENRPPPDLRRLSPVTSQHHTLHTAQSPRRSQSVPIFTSVPHIDLHHVPRSPGKSTAELRIASVPLASSDGTSNQDDTLLFTKHKEASHDVSSVLSTPPSKRTVSSHLQLSPLTPLPTTPGPLILQLASSHGFDPPQSSARALTDALSVEREDQVVPPASTSKRRPPGSSYSRLPRPSAVPVPISRREENRKKPTSFKNKRSHQAGVTTATPNVLSRRITRSVSLRHREINRNEAHSEGVIVPSVKPSITVTALKTNVAYDGDASSSSTSSRLDSANNSSVASSKKTRQPTLFSFAKPTASSTAKSSAPSHATNIASARRPIAVTKEDIQDNSSLASSLSSLSNALQRLNMPPPSRPSTSMGFNHTEPSEDRGFDREDGFGDARTRDDMDITSVIKSDDGSVSLRGGSVPLKRAATMNSLPVLSAGLRQSTLMLPPPVPRQSADAKRVVQANLLVGEPGNKLRFGRSDVAVQSGRAQPRPRIFAVAGSSRSGASLGSRVAYKASKKTSLPSVEGSPTKGNPASSVLESADGDGPPQTSEENITNSLGTASGQPSSLGSDAVNRSTHVDELSGESSQSAQGRDTSRRASLASFLFSQPSSSLPQTPVSQPSATQALINSPGKGKGVVRTPTGISSNTDLTHLVRTAPAALSRSTSIGVRISGRKTGADFGASPKEGASKPQGLLEVLKDCTIFVDVRTDDGDDAGALFVDMLKGMGARILTRVGQTCTHIVYKNGLVSTLTRYRLLKEPRPLAVGIAWVVECAEQRSHVDETRFLISLDEENVAGMNKRRRSMLPKQIQSPSSIPANPVLPLPSNTSIDVGENSVIAPGKPSQTPSPMTDDASSPPHTSGSVNVLPLENARRRRSMVFGS